MPQTPPTTEDVQAPRLARVVKATTIERDGLERGRIWVEAYLPFDAAAFAEFTRLAVQLGAGGPANYRAAAASDPALARRALDPIDSHGEAMLPADLEALADRFIRESRKIDVQHDESARQGVHLVGSFVNGPEIASPHYFPGAWVTVLDVEPWTPEFQAIKAGTLNAVSFQAYVRKVPIVPLVQAAQAAPAT